MVGMENMGYEWLLFLSRPVGPVGKMCGGPS